MNTIGNTQISNNVTQQKAAPVAQKAAVQANVSFNSPTLPQQVSPVVQQLLQFSKEVKSQEHAEHLAEHGIEVDEDFQSELSEITEGTTDEEQLEGGQRDGQQENFEEAYASESEDPSSGLSTALPVSVSGGGITVGLPVTSNKSKSVPVPDHRIIAIHGQNYSVAFLKRQVGSFASSSFANAAQDPDGVSLAQAPVSTPWGGAILAGSAAQFESYIRATFPGGDPDVPANPSVKYEAGSLLVNGQAYGVNLNDPKLAGSVDSFLISYSPAQQAEVQRVLHDFSELNIMNELNGMNGRNSYMVSVPADYYGQWQAALEDNLPDSSKVKIPERFV